MCCAKYDANEDFKWPHSYILAYSTIYDGCLSCYALDLVSLGQKWSYLNGYLCRRFATPWYSLRFIRFDTDIDGRLTAGEKQAERERDAEADTDQSEVVQNLQ
jgi:hypothetical protein